MYTYSLKGSHLYTRRGLMYWLKVVQSRQTTDVLTRVKVIIYRTLLNTLYIYISHMTRLLHLFRQVIPRARNESHLGINLSSNPSWGTIYWNIFVSLDLDLFQFTLPEADTETIVALRIHLRPWGIHFFPIKKVTLASSFPTWSFYYLHLFEKVT